MSLLSDWYWRTVQKNECEIKEHTSIIDSFGELKQSIKFGPHQISPLDSGRDYNKQNIPQRLKVELNQGVKKGSKSWNPNDLLSDLTSILAVVTGRTMRPARGFIINNEDEKKVVGYESKRQLKGHPNVLCPILDPNIQEKADKFYSSLTKIKDDNDVSKHRALIKSMNLYRDSLNILPYDEDTAYLILVTAIEVLGSEFSNISPIFSDMQNASSIQKVLDRHNASAELSEELKSILIIPRHLKLRAKFVDVVKSNLSDAFLDNPLISMIPVGKYDQNSDTVEIHQWRESTASKFLTRDLLVPCLKNIYDCRSSFVHGGEEWPYSAKIGHSHDLVQFIKVDAAGNPMKNPDGTHVLDKPVPTYFWFERAVNEVITNIIQTFSKTTPRQP